MSHVPPFHLDPYVAVRNPDDLPVLFRRGMYNVIKRETTGDLHDKYVKAFNFIAKGFTDSGRIKKGTLKLTPMGIKREKQVLREQISKMKLRWIAKWADHLRTQDPDRYDKSWWDERSDSD